jgi:hypothetical protein
MPEGPQGKIFINYRRGDDWGFALMLFEHLKTEFGAARLFMDIEGYIKPGDDFIQEIRSQVAHCDVLIAVIGPRWVNLLDTHAASPHDFVVIEIQAALDQGKRIIPTLVGGAQFPAVDILPEPIQALARKNAVGLRPERFKADCLGLVHALREAFAAAETERAARTEAERQAAAEARKKREADEKARAEEIELRKRELILKSRTPEEVREAAEIENWEHIKESANPDEFRDHLARFAGSTTKRFTYKKLEALLWANPATRASIEALSKFIEEFPKGDNTAQAQAKLGELQEAAEARRREEKRKRDETEAWASVADSPRIADLDSFLKQWPDGMHANDAKARIDELKARRLKRRRMIGRSGIGIAICVTMGAIWLFSVYWPELFSTIVKSIILIPIIAIIIGAVGLVIVELSMYVKECNINFRRDVLPIIMGIFALVVMLFAGAAIAYAVTWVIFYLLDVVNWIFR